MMGSLMLMPMPMLTLEEVQASVGSRHSVPTLKPYKPGHTGRQAHVPCATQACSSQACGAPCMTSPRARTTPARH